VNKNSPAAKLYNQAEEAIEKERYIIAEEKLAYIPKNYPYSEFATRARLRLADVYFFQERYPEASTQYTLFRDLHPNHPKSAYVVFQKGKSDYLQIPDHEGRDRSKAFAAIETFKTLLIEFPRSQYANEAAKFLKKAKELLAEKENYVASWYYGQEHYKSAAGRYEYMLRKFADTDYEEIALAGYVMSWARMEEANPRVKNAARILLKKYPENNAKDDAVTTPWIF
jgi:outer membrane protein assembly factor BamD